MVASRKGVGMDLLQSGMLWGFLSLIMLGVIVYLARPFYQNSQSSNNRLSLIVLAVFLPLAALGLYLIFGMPSLKDQPLAARLDKPLEELSPLAIIAKLEARLRENPEDAVGWRILARVRGRASDPVRAVDAWRRVLELQGPDVESLTSLAGALMEQEDGIISGNAQRLIDHALSLQADDPMALYLSGLSKLQAGQKTLTRQQWEQSRSTVPADSPWHKFMSGRLQQLNTP